MSGTSEASATELSATALPLLANPFVGPRSVMHGEALHGRGREVDDLYDRLQARRVVVLHSPSGAGKTSLVQAGLVPMLRKGRYDVWTPIRVNLDLQGLEGVHEGTNRYLLSAMVSLEEELPATRRRSPVQLAELDLVDYLRTRPRRKGKRGQSVVLLFDQFEEVLTVAPRAVEAKREFFDAVGRALHSEGYWALFIIREDYLAALAPYRDRIPTQLANTFRLDLLSLDSAREAAEQLTHSGGRVFPAVDQLIDDLSRVQVQQPDGTFVAEQGIHVEPVQLQVVCRRLWDAMPPDDRSIDHGDIDEYADVSTSLARYYADSVRAIANGDLARERALRDWIGQELIVGGHRSCVRQDASATVTLDERIVGQLLDSYLMRCEQRAGANWFELSHDRLVEPILEDNEKWARAHLHPVQVQAKLWDDGGRTNTLLLPAEAVHDAQEWADDNLDLLTEAEREFLELSHARQLEHIRHRRRQRTFVATLGATAIVAASLGGAAWVMQRRAEQQRQDAVHATEQAQIAQEVAEGATEVAVRAQQEAQSAQEVAERAQRRNEHLVRDLLRQMFQVALRRFIHNLAEHGLTSGEIEVDRRWTPLLEWKGQKFAAANIVHGGGRIVAAGQDAVLREVDHNGDSVFVEITIKWLLGDQARRTIAVLSQRPGSAPRLGPLEQSLTALGYEYEIDPPLDHIDRLPTVGMLIIDNRGVDFTPQQVETVEAFIRRGGGVLAVGGGWSWRGPSMDDYPLNRLLGSFGVRWTDRTIDPRELRKVAEQATIRFNNRSDHAIDVFSRDASDHEEFYISVPAGQTTSTTTTIGHRWAIRRSGDRRLIRALVIDQDEQMVFIGKKPAPPSPKPSPTLAVPTVLSRQQMKSALAAATTASQDCGRRHGSLVPSVKIKFEVGPDGTVDDARVLAPLQGTAVGICAAKGISSQRFPKSQRGVSTTWTLPL